MGLDVASSEFKVEGENAYDLDFKTTGPEKDTSLKLSGDELMALYKDIADRYPIVTMEDPFDQNGQNQPSVAANAVLPELSADMCRCLADWENWSKFTDMIGEQCQVVGDDLTVTNPLFIERAIKEKSANCLLLKVNQIGSISESIAAVKLSKQSGWGVMCSHRSGETEDTTIADLAVGLATGQIKTGAPCRGER